MARWRSNYIDGRGTEYLIVGENVASEYRTRMLRLELVSGYDPQEGRTTGPTRIKITECTCPVLVDLSSSCAASRSTCPPAALELGCACETPRIVCEQ